MSGATAGRHRIAIGDNTLGSLTVLGNLSAEIVSCQVNADQIEVGGAEVEVQATVANTGEERARVRVRWFAEANGTRIGDVAETTVAVGERKVVTGALPLTQSAWEDMGRPSSLGVDRRIANIERA